MSPGQCQKLTRLQAARRLLAAGTHSASAAALAVGSVSEQQLSRDYRGRYGVPPGRDAREMRGGTSSR
ncbi:MAG: helix-turn-helix domain-containing protein [Janthinobacterium lividum]